MTSPKVCQRPPALQSLAQSSVPHHARLGGGAWQVMFMQCNNTAATAGCFRFSYLPLTLDTNCLRLGSSSSSCRIVCCTILMYVRTFIPLVFLSSLGRLACLNFLILSFLCFHFLGFMCPLFNLHFFFNSFAPSFTLDTTCL